MNYSTASGPEIKIIVDKIQDVCLGSSMDHIVMACLAIAVMLHTNESLTGEQLAEGIRGASEWIALYGDSLEPVDPAKVN